MPTSERMTTMKAATLGLIKRIENETLTDDPAQEVYELLADSMRTNYPEFTADEIDHCVYYAMQASLF